MVEAGEGGFQSPSLFPHPPGYRLDDGSFLESQGPGFLDDHGEFHPYRQGTYDDHGNFQEYHPGFYDEHNEFHEFTDTYLNSYLYQLVHSGEHTHGYGPAPDSTPKYHAPDTSNVPISEQKVKKGISVPPASRSAADIIYTNTESSSKQRPLPESAIKQTLVIGGKSPGQLETMLEQAGIALNFSNNDARDLLHSKEFTTLPIPKSIVTVRLKVRDLGLPESPSPDVVYKKAKEYGLDLCPPEVGPWMRMSYKNQPELNHLRIAMKEIYVRPHDPLVFSLDRFGWPLCLGGHYMNSESWWDLRDELVFLLHQG